MRLLNIHTQEFREFDSTEQPPYAIASHRWSKSETTYKKFNSQDDVDSSGRRKVENFCRVVKEMKSRVNHNPAWKALGFSLGCDWLWIDTACIDKTDSVELSEAINSMFRWYRGAAVCYAYLHDVRSTKEFQGAMVDFMQTDWLTRGWTLQELLGPAVVVFFTSEWEVLGHKCGHDKSLCKTVCRGFRQRLDFILSRITKIPLDVIRKYSSANGRSIEEKMSWLHGRRTTRPEDRAYCLLGICDVFMPPIYGEGKDAWRRLQNLVEERAKQKNQPRPLPVLPEEDIVDEPPVYAVESSPLTSRRQYGTHAEQRVRKKVLWSVTKRALYSTPRSRTDAAQAKRRLLQCQSTLRYDPKYHSTESPPNLTRSQCRVEGSAPSPVTSPKPKLAEQTVFQPEEIAHWLLYHDLPIIGDKQVHGDCYGEAHCDHGATPCQSPLHTANAHRDCVLQRWPKCRHLANPGASYHPEEQTSSTSPTTTRQCCAEAADPLSAAVAADRLSSKDAESIEKLISEIVARRLDLDMKTGANSALGDDFVSGSLDQDTQKEQNPKPLSRQLTTSLKRRFTSGYWREGAFGRVGRRKTEMRVGEEPSKREEARRADDAEVLGEVLSMR